MLIIIISINISPLATSSFQLSSDISLEYLCEFCTKAESKWKQSSHVSRDLVVICPFSTKLYSEESWFFFCFPIPYFFLPSFFGLSQVHQLQMPSPPPSCSTVFSFFRLGLSICTFFRLLILSLLLECFSHRHLLTVYHWSLNDSKSPLVSRTFLSILDDRCNTVVWMLSALPLISSSSDSFTRSLVTVPSAPIIIGITVTFMSLFFFSSLILSLFIPWEFFTSALDDGLSQKFEWQQISSSLQDSSQYSDRSQ